MNVASRLRELLIVISMQNTVDILIMYICIEYIGMRAEAELSKYRPAILICVCNV